MILYLKILLTLFFSSTFYPFLNRKKEEGKNTFTSARGDSNMSSDILRFNLQTIDKSKNPHSFRCHFTSILTHSLQFPTQHRRLHLTTSPCVNTRQTGNTYLPSIHCDLSSPTPPKSKEEAISQAKVCLSTALEKPLNNPKLAGKLKKLRQPRFRVEIPVIDDSPDSMTKLALQMFDDMPVRRKGSKVKILILWPNPASAEAAIRAFSSQLVEHIDISSISDGDNRILTSADLAVFLAPEASQLEVMEALTNSLYPKPVVVFNPRWGFEEESGFGELSGFLSSFEVIYSFMGLEVRGLLSKRGGVVFKCVRDGILSGEKWSVLVEEEGELKVVSRFKTRPSIAEVENVLYNLMAINSPITKSAKFLKGLVSNVTGKR